MADDTVGVEKDEQEVIVIHDVSRYEKRQKGLGISEGGPAYTLDVSGRQAVLLDTGGIAEDRGSGIAVPQQVTVKQLQGIADRVNRSAGITFESIIETGEQLLEAKKTAGHGGWQKLFDSGALERPIRFSVRTARRYMAIAGKAGDLKVAALAKSDDMSVFPASVTTLEAIAKLPDELLRQALADGRINPDMELSDVRKLRRETKRAASVASLAMGTPRFVTTEVLNAASAEPTTVILNGGGRWSRKASKDRFMTAVKLEFEQYFCCREDRPDLSRILRELAADIDAGTQMMALQGKYVDVASLPQADRVTRILPAVAEKPARASA